MKNITELRDQLSSVFQELRNGTLDVKIASEMNNSAGKMINTIKVELEYSHLRKEKPNIEFLNK